ncbi:MAG: hypothetical protein VCE75_22745 [Alphaproteobacteria bacterium]
MEVLEQYPDIDLLFRDMIMPVELDGNQVALEAHKDRQGSNSILIFL